MTGYRDMLNDGAKRRAEAARQVETDLDGLDPPTDELATIAYWDCMRDQLGDRTQEAVGLAREAGHAWAEIAGALDTSTESARGRYQYYKNRK